MKKKKTQKKQSKEKRKLSLKFASILAIVSIVGFLQITTNSLFQFSFEPYSDFLWLTIVGIGFLVMSKPKELTKKKDEPINEITALVIGVIAVVAGILSLPFLNVVHPLFLSIKGVIAIIAIVFIILETWFIKN